MSNYAGYFLFDGLSDPVLEAQPETRYISGVVTNNTVPKKRRLLLFKDSSDNPIAETWSDTNDGTFSFAVPLSGSVVKYTVVCKGEYGERDMILSGITAGLE